MTEKQSPELKIGVMVFVAMIFVTLAVFYIGDYNFFVKGYQFKVVFNHASGITLGSPVNLNGIKVGDVKEIDFIYVENLSKVRLNIWVSEKAVFHTNCRITIDTLGLMGEKIINIISRDATSPKVKAGSELVGIDPPQISELLAYGSDIAEELKKTIKAVNLIVGDVETKNAIRNNLKNTEKLTGELADMVSNSKDDVEQIMSNTQSITASLDKILIENRDNFKKTVDNMQIASVTIKEGSVRVATILEKFGRNVNKLVLDNRDDVKNLIDNLVATSNELEASMGPITENLKEISQNLNSLVSENQGKVSETIEGLRAITSESRGNILQAMENFEKISSDIKSISEKSQESIQSTVDNVAAISQRLKEVLDKFNVIAEKIEKGEGTLGGLLADKEIFDDLKKLIQDVNAHPWKLLRKD